MYFLIMIWGKGSGGGGGGAEGGQISIVGTLPSSATDSVKQDGRIFRRVQGVREGGGGGELIWGEGWWCGVAGGREVQ